MDTPRQIIHIDMDAFFAAVEQRDEPAYRGRPVVVGADPKGGKGRGVVSTCSYEARAFGIHSAMPISRAYRLCPRAVFLPVDMERYAAASKGIYRIFESFTPDIEPIGIDEAFLDITHSHHLFGTPLETCRALKKRIFSEHGLTASVGLAPTMMAAKIASDLRKPDGLVEVRPEGLIGFLWPLEIRRLWGLGRKSEAALHAIGIRTIGDLAQYSVRELERLFGRSGTRFWELANGMDDRAVTTPGDAKSVSNETTFDADTADRSVVERELAHLAEKVSLRLRADRLKCRTMTLKLRFEGFETHTRSVTVGVPTNYFDALYKEMKRLYNTFEKCGRRVRLVGVRASHLVPSDTQCDLFDGAADDRTEKAHAAVDRITRRFGDGAIFRAGSRSTPAPAAGHRQKEYP